MLKPYTVTHSNLPPHLLSVNSMNCFHSAVGAIKHPGLCEAERGGCEGVPDREGCEGVQQPGRAGSEGWRSLSLHLLTTSFHTPVAANITTSVPVISITI